MVKRQAGESSLFAAGVAAPSRAHRRRVGILLLVVLATGQACYTYHATELPDLQPGEEVRLVLVQAGYRRVAPGASQGAAPRLEGRLVGVKTDSLTLSVWIGEPYLGTPFEAAYQDLVIPLDDIQRFEHRELSKGRTALAATGVVALIVVLIESIGFTNLLGSGGENGPPDPPDPTGIRAWRR